MRKRALWVFVALVPLVWSCGNNCGPGTVASDGVCVLDASQKDVLSDFLRPRVDSFELLSFEVAEEIAGYELYVDHPMTVDLKYKVVGEPFETNIEVFLETEDGSQSCVAGSFNIVHVGLSNEAVDAKLEEIIAEHGGHVTDTHEYEEMNATIEVRSECKPLVEQGKLKVELAFDPALRVRLQGRNEELPDITEDENHSIMAQMARPFILPFSEECHADAATGHDSCLTTMMLHKSPGFDLELVDFDTNVVALVEYEVMDAANVVTEDSMDAAESLETGTGDEVEAFEASVEAKVAEGEHFDVNVSLMVHGLDLGHSESFEETDATINLSAAIRPLQSDHIDYEAVADVDAWYRLQIQRDEVTPEGEHMQVREYAAVISIPTGGELESESLAVHIPEHVVTLMTGDFASYQLYELQVCVEATGIEEHGGHSATEATENNCVVKPVVVLLKPILNGSEGETNAMLGYETPATAAGAYSLGKRLEKFYGNQYVGVAPFIEFNGLTNYSFNYVQSAAGIDVNGHYSFNLAKLEAKIWDAPTGDDIFEASVGALGFSFPFRTSIPDNFEIVAGGDSVSINGVVANVSFPTEISKDKEKCKDIWAQVAWVRLCAGGVAAAGFDVGATYNREDQNEAYLDAQRTGKCHGLLCYKFNAVPRYSQDAERSCREGSGTLASPKTLDQYNTIKSTIPNGYWARVGAKSSINSPKQNWALMSYIEARDGTKYEYGGRGIDKCYVKFSGPMDCQYQGHHTWGLGKNTCQQEKVQNIITGDYNTSAFVDCKPGTRLTPVYQQAQDAYYKSFNDYHGGAFRATGILDAGSPLDVNVPWRNRSPNCAWCPWQGKDDYLGSGDVILWNTGSPGLDDIGTWIPVPYVCEYSASGMNFGLSFEPYVKATATGKAGLTLKLATAGLYIEVDIIKLSFPVEGELNLITVPAARLVAAKGNVGIDFVINTLDGAFGGFVQALNEEESWEFGSWEGYELLRTTLFEHSFPIGAFTY